ncbi:hypothetical protein B0H11DRAFT_734802 [Mycena galericulata]|nr:hypothetical protein B0H11DRAFT_734802 [Mycena galericulata]
MWSASVSMEKSEKSEALESRRVCGSLVVFDHGEVYGFAAPVLHGETGLPAGICARGVRGFVGFGLFLFVLATRRPSLEHLFASSLHGATLAPAFVRAVPAAASYTETILGTFGGSGGFPRASCIRSLLLLPRLLCLLVPACFGLFKRLDDVGWSGLRVVLVFVSNITEFGGEGMEKNDARKLVLVEGADLEDMLADLTNLCRLGDHLAVAVDTNREHIVEEGGLGRVFLAVSCFQLRPYIRR